LGKKGGKESYETRKDYLIEVVATETKDKTHKAHMETNDQLSLAQLSIDRDFLQPSFTNWGVIPRSTWEGMMKQVTKKLPEMTVAIFTLAIYEYLHKSSHYSRPPKGIIPKHLCLLLLHWLCKGKQLSAYGHDGSLPCGLAKSYIHKALAFVLRNGVAQFVKQKVHPRSVDEMIPLVEERLAAYGDDFPIPICREVWYSFPVGRCFF
jgi:hypothetical protein